MSKLISPIPETVRDNQWEVRVNGKLFSPVNEVRIFNPKFGELSFGLRPEKTVGWMWREIGGGGVGIVPYLVREGHLFIGMIKQERACQGGLVWNIPRGFLDPTLSHFESAVKEGDEELGMPIGKRLTPLSGEPANPNSTFFDTRGEETGFRYYALEVLSHEVVCEAPFFRTEIKKGLFRPKSTIAERIIACCFFPWCEAAEVADQFTVAGVARLLAHHYKEGTPLPLLG